MSAYTKEGLLSHSGHSLSIYYYGKRENPDSVTIECDECNEVLISIDEDDELTSNYDENRGEGTDELK